MTAIALILSIGVGAFLSGVGVTLLLVGRRRPAAAELPADELHEDAFPPVAISALERESSEDEATPLLRSEHAAILLAQALRQPLRALRRSSCPTALLEQLERVAWQARMLTAAARPMKGQPASPIAMLQEAAEAVEPLRMGKVGISWGLLTRQPVHVDVERAQSALRELLVAAVHAVGEGGRLAIRVHECELPGYPVQIEIEAGRRGGEPDALSCAVARHLLEGQGARVDIEPPVMRVALRAQPAEPPQESSLP